MLWELFKRVFRSFVPEEADDDLIMGIIGAILATFVTVITAIVALPLLFRDEHETAIEALWRYKWAYVVYSAIGVFILANLYYGYSTLSSAGLGSVVLVVYVVVTGLLRYWGSTPDVDDWLRNAQNGDSDEFELPMTQIREKSRNASRQPSLRKDESTLVIGSSRSGKTSALKLLAAQMNYSKTAVFAHGSVGEYTEYFEEDLSMHAISIGVRHSSATWNLFLDAQSDRELDLIAKGLFGEGDDYFDKSARQVFGAILKALDREKSEPGHEDIQRVVNESTAEETYEKLKEYPDLKAAAEHIDPSAEKQQRGVWSNVVQVVNDAFVGDFAENGEFSFTDYVNSPNNRAVVFESPEVSGSVGPMYRVMIDTAIRISMNHSAQGFMLLDEIDTLPPLSNLSDLASRGLAQNTRMLLGVQTIGQLKDVYGKSIDGVTGNCNQIIGLSPGNDTGDTLSFYQKVLGEKREMVPSSSVSQDVGVGKGQARRSHSRQERDRVPVDTHSMNQWGKGEGLISTRERWWVGKLAYYGNVKERYS